MTVDTTPYRSRFFALTALSDMTVATQVMKHFFDVRCNRDISLMAKITVAFPGIVYVIVMALQAIHAPVIGVIKLYRQYRCSGDHRVPVVGQENSCRYQT